MTERTRRVGLLKAVGASPGLVTATLMAENLVLALAAAGVGLVAGWLAAPLLTSPGRGAGRHAGRAVAHRAVAGLVLAVALAVALAATLVPAIRAARGSTVSALADAPRPPRRRPRCSRCPGGCRCRCCSGCDWSPAGRGGPCSARPTSRSPWPAWWPCSPSTPPPGRQSTAGAAACPIPVYNRDEQVLLVLTVMLLTLAALNAVVTAWSTMLDTRHPAALARALGATPRDVAAGLTAAQLLPACLASLLGIPLGIGLFAAADHGGLIIVPPAWWLAAAVLGRWPPSRGSRPSRRASAPAARRPRSCRPRRPDERAGLVLPGGPARGRGRPAHRGLRVGQELGRRGDRLPARAAGRAVRAARPGLPELGGRWHRAIARANSA